MDQSKLDDIRQANDIIDVVGSYIPLKRKSGSNFTALCPFHDEKTPSFIVSQAKQIYKCFGCGKAGNVFTFVRDIERISFFEAVKKLATRAGIELPSYNKGQNQQNSKQQQLISVYKLANSFFKQNFKRYGDELKQYLQKRKISQKTAEDFELGYALNSFNSLKNHLSRNSIGNDLLKLSGLLGFNDKGSYDIFRQRLMFPIHNDTGKVVAFSGRILSNDQKGGKYVNSPTTPIYTKGDVLYGLHLTKYEISKVNLAIVCEGNLDFLRLYESGFTNSVAQLGTSLTEKQIKLLLRYTPKCVLLYDGDNAGKKAAIRNARLMLENNMDVAIATMPNGFDPDTFLIKFGSGKLQELINKASSLSSFIKSDTSQNLSQKQKLDFLAETALNFNDLVKKELFAKEVSDSFKISETAFLSGLKQNKNQQNSKLTKQKLNKFLEERELLKHVLTEASELKNFAERIDETYFFDESYKKLFIELLNINLVEEYPAEQVIGILSEESSKLAGDLLLDEKSDLSVSDILNQIILRKLQKELEELELKLRSFASNPEQLNKLLRRKSEIKKEIFLLSRKVTFYF